MVLTLPTDTDKTRITKQTGNGGHFWETTTNGYVGFDYANWDTLYPTQQNSTTHS